MTGRKGFTLVELMIVVLIVGVLAAVLVPMLTARLESARWSEGKAGVGTISTAIRALYAEQGEQFVATTTVTDYINAEDLQGRYFSVGCYSLSGVTVPTGGGVDNWPVHYNITVTNPVAAGETLAAPGAPGTNWKVTSWTMDHMGNWSKSP